MIPTANNIKIPDGLGGTPDEDVALTHWEGVKFLAGINHNTPFVFIHDINIMYGMLISCKELHWSRQLEKHRGRKLHP